MTRYECPLCRGPHSSVVYPTIDVCICSAHRTHRDCDVMCPCDGRSTRPMAEPGGVVASHTNSERELLTIERANSEAFAGQLLLVIHDDGPLGVKAPMLLDEGTQRFLRRYLGGEHAEVVVDRIIADLSGRKGLGDEWDQIDDEIRAEIRARWIVMASDAS